MRDVLDPSVALLRPNYGFLKDSDQARAHVFHMCHTYMTSQVANHKKYIVLE
jgi:hypothetical protein